MSNIATTQNNQVASFSKFMDGFKKQMQLALPKHLTPDRMARLVLSEFSKSEQLQRCEPRSIAASVMTACTLGLEIGYGQGYLIPYKTTCTFVPGWKGLVDIANRSGRVSVWTGAVFDGDTFEYALGDRPFVNHVPGDEDGSDKLTHVYAVGRVRGSEYPVIEVWSLKKVRKHRDKYNKVGNRHYSFRDEEMYARKVALLQVLKYMPSSVELSNAVTASNAAEMNREVLITGDMITFKEDPASEYDGALSGGDKDDEHGSDDGGKEQPQHMSDADFATKSHDWKNIIEGGKKSVNDLIAFIETKGRLSDDQKMIIASWTK
jgi:recombination protein RecT